MQKQLKEFIGIDPLTLDYITKKHMLDVTNMKNMKDSLRLQTILIDIEPNFHTLTNYIMNSFDLNICKNVFYYDTDGCHLNIKKAFEIIDKKTNFCFNPTCSEPLKRYIKYKERGFTFIEDKKIIFNMIVDKSLCMNYNINQLNKKFKLFEVRSIDNIQMTKQYTNGYTSNYELEKFELVKNLYNDTFPIFDEEKLNGTYFDGSIFLFNILEKKGCDDNCPINICFGSDIKHFHRDVPTNFNNNYIFIYQ